MSTNWNSNPHEGEQNSQSRHIMWLLQHFCVIASHATSMTIHKNDLTVWSCVDAWLYIHLVVHNICDQQWVQFLISGIFTDILLLKWTLTSFRPLFRINVDVTELRPHFFQQQLDNQHFTLESHWNSKTCLSKKISRVPEWAGGWGQMYSLQCHLHSWRILQNKFYILDDLDLPTLTTWP